MAWQNRQVVYVPVSETIAQYHSVEINDTLVKTVLGIGTYMGIGTYIG